MRALGVDVAARRGCDVVALGPDRVARRCGRVHRPAELRALAARERADVVAIDAPARYRDPDRTRAGEADLLARGLRLYPTPTAAVARGNSFYDWMRTGVAMHRAAAAHRPVEVFPHASAVALHGVLPPEGVNRSAPAKRAWRVAALVGAGVDASTLRTIDEVDAALAALTGLVLLEGGATRLGDDADGWIVLPVADPPARYTRPGVRAR